VTEGGKEGAAAIVLCVCVCVCVCCVCGCMLYVCGHLELVVELRDAPGDHAVEAGGQRVGAQLEAHLRRGRGKVSSEKGDKDESDGKGEVRPEGGEKSGRDGGVGGGLEGGSRGSWSGARR
jgi:hypothetical protein